MWYTFEPDVLILTTSRFLRSLNFFFLPFLHGLRLGFVWWRAWCCMIKTAITRYQDGPPGGRVAVHNARWTETWPDHKGILDLVYLLQPYLQVNTLQHQKISRLDSLECSPTNLSNALMENWETGPKTRAIKGQRCGGSSWIALWSSLSNYPKATESKIFHWVKTCLSEGIKLCVYTD